MVGSLRITVSLEWLVMTPPLATIDHVQLAMPIGAEDTARGFYSGVLGMAEIPKPSELAKRGGCGH